MTPTSPNGRPQTAPRADAPAPPSPARALDPSAGGGLLKASVQAAIGFAVLFAGLTVGPYFWDKSQANANPKKAPGEKASPAAAAQPAPAAPASPEPNSKLPAGAPVAGKPPAKDDIVSKLGENGTKTAPSKVNPLDKKDDDILKDIK